MLNTIKKVLKIISNILKTYKVLISLDIDLISSFLMRIYKVRCFTETGPIFSFFYPLKTVQVKSVAKNIYKIEINFFRQQYRFWKMF